MRYFLNKIIQLSWYPIAKWRGKFKTHNLLVRLIISISIPISISMCIYIYSKTLDEKSLRVRSFLLISHWPSSLSTHLISSINHPQVFPQTPSVLGKTSLPKTRHKKYEGNKHEKAEGEKKIRNGVKMIFY